MGQDKALMELGGVTLAEIGLGKLCAVCADVAIAGGGSELERFGRVIPDGTIPDGTVGCGPLGGIVAALEQSFFEWNVFLAVDVPLLPVEVLRALLRTAEEADVAVMAEAGGQVHPLCGVYARRALPVLREELATGRYKVRSAMEAAGRVSYVRFEVEEWFRNVNTPEEFRGVVGLVGEGFSF